MAESSVNGQFVAAISSTLDSIMAPYEWRNPTKYITRLTFEQRIDEFGCLRRANWPHQFKDGLIVWNLVYEGKRGSGNTIYFHYNATTKTFTVSGSKLLAPHADFVTEDMGEAFERLERRIEEIPLEP